MSVSRYVRKGQRTYFGMTVEEVRLSAKAHRERAFLHYYGNGGDQEIASREKEAELWLRQVALRMEEPRV